MSIIALCALYTIINHHTLAAILNIRVTVLALIWNRLGIIRNHIISTENTLRLIAYSIQRTWIAVVNVSQTRVTHGWTVDCSK